MEQPLLSIKDVDKSFPGVKALSHACLNVYPGKVMALMGEKADGQNRNGQNDQEILAVAARYKLNDVVLYTEDKNLKNHATAVGIKTI